jgi:Subtilase family
MKKIFFCACIVALFCVQAAGQKKPGLSDFSKERSRKFISRQAKVEAFSRLHQTPVFFTDSSGTHVRLVNVNSRGIPEFRSTLNADAARTTGVVQLRSGGTSGLNLQGNGMLIGVWDGGRVKDHIELGLRVISKEGATEDSHATHVTGTLIATGIDLEAKGMAPLAKATAWYFDNDEADMAVLAKPDQSSLLVSNHSYGTVTGWFKSNGVWKWTGDDSISPVEDFRFGFYGERAQTLDQLTALAPYYTVVWAAGNDRADVGTGSNPADCNSGSGYDCIIPESVAKNIITVGAVSEVASYTGPFSVGMSFFSSWGPTDDGRIKPDFVGDGVNVYSLSAAGTNSYATMSGTSMATPNVSGSLLLLQELYSKLHGGNYMKSATLKALAIHTTKEAGNFPGPDYSFGWGLLDDAAAAKLLMSQDEENTFVEQLQVQEDQDYRLTISPKANQKITATIAWTDPAGKPVADAVDPTNLMLVNDLDLRIIDDQGREQLPWTLDLANPSRQAVAGDNFRDNVEKIEFSLPEGKSYTLVVRHKNKLSGGTQDFSLILTYQSSHAASTLYWIGGTGSWTSASHWSLTTKILLAVQVRFRFLKMPRASRLSG